MITYIDVYKPAKKTCWVSKMNHVNVDIFPTMFMIKVGIQPAISGHFGRDIVLNYLANHRGW